MEKEFEKYGVRINVEEREKVERFLVELGIPVYMIGLRYLSDAIAIVIEDSDKRFEIVKNILMPLTEIYGKKDFTQIRSSMARAIKHACFNDGILLLNDYIDVKKYSESCEPKCTEFISFVAYIFILNLKRKPHSDKEALNKQLLEKIHEAFNNPYDYTD